MCFFGNGLLCCDIGGWGIDLLVQVIQNFVGGILIVVQMQIDDNFGFILVMIVVVMFVVLVVQLVVGYCFFMSDFLVGMVECYVCLNYVVVGIMMVGMIMVVVVVGVDCNV